MQGIWDTINSSIAQASGTMTSVYSLRAKVQQLKNAQAAQQQPAPLPVLGVAPAPVVAPVPQPGQPQPKNNVMLYIGGAVVAVLFGFVLMRRK